MGLYGERRSMVSAAVVTAAAAMVTAGVSFAMMIVVMMVAPYVGIISQLTLEQGFNSGIGTAGYATKKLHTGSCQRHLGAAADSAADQHIGFQGSQNTRQSTVAAAVGIHDLRGQDLAVLNIVDLELLGVTKVLKDISIFISDCDSHK